MDAAQLWFLVAALGVSFYMAFNIGANDLANAMGTSVGSKALTVRRAVIAAALLNLLGAIFVGSKVTDTIRGGIVDTEVITGGDAFSWTLMYGLLSAILAGALFITVATWWGLPVSTTHAIVGALLGFGLVAGGMAAVQWKALGRIMASWVISPLAGAFVAFWPFWLVSRGILKKKDPVKYALRYAPWLFAIVFGILAIALFEEGLKNLDLHVGLLGLLLISALVATAGGIGAHLFFRRYRNAKSDDYATVERIFAILQVTTACYVAFAHGSNDVANAIGPVSGIVGQLAYGSTTDVPRMAVVGLLLVGGVGIAIGTATWGIKVMTTIGEKITSITPTRGFCAEFSTATTVLVCSMMGLPISTTHTIVGAVIGVGLAGGLAGVDVRVIKRIFISWLITVPAAALTCMAIYLGIVFIA